MTDAAGQKRGSNNQETKRFHAGSITTRRLLTAWDFNRITLDGDCALLFASVWNFTHSRASIRPKYPKLRAETTSKSSQESALVVSLKLTLHLRQ